MISVLNFVKKQTAILAAVLIGSVVGGATTAVVLAAIPDSTGVIHGCIRPTNNNLRIIDTEAGQTCTGGQTPINWDQEGVKAYGHIFRDATIDNPRSKNINIVSYIDASQSGLGHIYCFDLATSVKVVSVTLEDTVAAPLASVAPGTEGWNQTGGSLCPVGTEAAVAFPGDSASGFYVSFQ